MPSWIVIYHLPELGSSKVIIPAPAAVANIYEAVKYLESRGLDIGEKINEKIFENIKLADLVPLHNETGLDHERVFTELIAKVKRGIHIFRLQSGVPNIQLVKIERKLIIFDGHHTVLAYMASGYSFLDEVPFVFVRPQDADEVTDKDLSVVVGDFKEGDLNYDWRTTVINWDSPEGKIFEPRKFQNMGKLYEAIKPFLRKRGILSR